MDAMGVWGQDGEVESAGDESMEENQDGVRGLPEMRRWLRISWKSEQLRSGSG